MSFHPKVLELQVNAEIDRICCFIKNQVIQQRKEGVVVGLSGGIDSALMSELCVRSLGVEKVKGILLPERESNPISREYAQKHAQKIGIDYEINDITPVLEAFETYKKRDSMISSIFSDYIPSLHRIKITLPPDLLNRDSYNFFTLQVMDEKTVVFSSRLKKSEFQTILAASDTKQRTRMMHLYYHAEKMNRLVCGTTNLPETMQGYFVKYGDGGVDIEPISHLYKTQVYQLSKELGVIKEIINREPSPDTFNSFVGDEEFFFRLPYKIIDFLLYAWIHKEPLEDICRVMDLSQEQLQRALRDIESKYKATKFLRVLPPNLL
jgi:NAD+ synthase